MNRVRGWFAAFGAQRGQWTDSPPVPEPRYLFDALRRCCELLEGQERPPNAGRDWPAERDHIVAVARRILRDRDPEMRTDRLVA